MIWAFMILSLISIVGNIILLSYCIIYKNGYKDIIKSSNEFVNNTDKHFKNLCELHKNYKLDCDNLIESLKEQNQKLIKLIK